MRLTLIVLLFGILSARSALAVNCAELPSPVYITGSTAARPLLVEISRYLVGQKSPISVIYLGQGSCAGEDAILNATPLSGMGAFSTWDSTGGETRCDVPDSAPVTADVGISGLPSHRTELWLLPRPRRHLE